MTFKYAALVILAGTLGLLAQERVVTDSAFTIHSLLIGPRLSFFNYRENGLHEEKTRAFEQQFGREPVFEGEPKSTESGLLCGLTLSSTWYSRSGRVSGGPVVSCQMGVLNQYDGSTQGEPIVDALTHDTIGVRFKPIRMTKANIFLDGEYLIGVTVIRRPVALGLLAGIRGQVWIRDFNDLGTKDDDGLTSNETYSWAGVPIGCTMGFGMGPQWRADLKLIVDCMFAGRMRVRMSVPEEYRTTFDFPAVNLGSKAGYRVEMAFQKNISRFFTVCITPFFQAYGFGMSNRAIATVTQDGRVAGKSEFVEPASTTFSGGLYVTAGVLSLKSRR